MVTMLVYFYSLFFDYYYEQRNHTAEVIVKSLKNNMSETSFTLSKMITSKDSIKTTRSILDRVAATSRDFVKAISVFNEGEFVITTDPKYKQKPLESLSYTNLIEDSYKVLMSNADLKGQLKFYEGNLPKYYQIYFILDHKEIRSYLSASQTKFIVYFGILPILLMLIIFIFVNVYLIKPLEKLRKYAYYQSYLPNELNIRELESIRYSMRSTFERLESEQEALYQTARTDSLSGLANRNALDEFMKPLIAESIREKQEFAFLFLDLDNFKTVNDSLGHDIGDQIIYYVSKVISEEIRINDFAARVGGDEFIIILKDYHSMDELIRVVSRVQKKIKAPMEVDGHYVESSCSIGVALYPKDALDYITLMKNADIAMYEAKKNGRDLYHFYSNELNERVQNYINLDKEMRLALQKNEYELFYQPLVNTKTGSIFGAEALIRWRSPEKGLITPNLFIPMAEENGFILELGDWILNNALEQLREWQQNGINIRMSINIAVKQFQAPGFLDGLMASLKTLNIEPACINLEITEYLFLEQTTLNLNIIDSIHEKGIGISLDDFGTGYSSLSCLKKFHVDNIKIDKTFIDDFEEEEDSIFIETIIKMGQTLHKTIITEGVESQAQVEYLKAKGCHLIQGYYFSKPLPRLEFEEFFKNTSADDLIV